MGRHRSLFLFIAARRETLRGRFSADFVYIGNSPLRFSNPAASFG
jgi:hypothetical protein